MMSSPAQSHVSDIAMSRSRGASFLLAPAGAIRIVIHARAHGSSWLKGAPIKCRESYYSCATSIDDNVCGKCQLRLFRLVPGADCINGHEKCGSRGGIYNAANARFLGFFRMWWRTDVEFLTVL